MMIRVRGRRGTSEELKVNWVVCDKNHDQTSDHGHITALVVCVGQGKLRREPVNEALKTRIDSGVLYLYTEVNGEEAQVVVVEGDGRLYATTHPDHTTRNNLLSLPECR